MKEFSKLRSLLTHKKEFVVLGFCKRRGFLLGRSSGGRATVSCSVNEGFTTEDYRCLMTALRAAQKPESGDRAILWFEPGVRINVEFVKVANFIFSAKFVGFAHVETSNNSMNIEPKAQLKASA